MAGGKQRGFVEFSADQLKADGNAASTDSARQDERRMSTKFEGAVKRSSPATNAGSEPRAAISASEGGAQHGPAS